MRVLVVERTSEAQAATARRFDLLDRIDKDILDLSLGLADGVTLFDRLDTCDVLLLGATLGEDNIILTQRIKEHRADLEVLVMLPREVYLGGGFRSALAHGARKVLCDDALSLDLVQELMSIHEAQRVQGKVREAQVIAVTQAKGGIGATTTCAALAEACAAAGMRVLLWDLDIETRDLCRAAVSHGQHATVVREMLCGELELSRDNVRRAVIPVSENVGVLPPPDLIAASLDFIGSVEAIDAAQSIISLARYMYDAVIVDIGSRLSPAAGAIMQASDSVVLMVDDSILGISAARFFAPVVRSVLRNPEGLSYLCSGISISKDELAHVVEQQNYSPSAWALPVIPFDSAASTWPGSGKTLYSLGKRQTQKTLIDLVRALGLVREPAAAETPAVVTSSTLRSYVYSISFAALMFGISYQLRAVWERFVNSY